MEKRAIIAAMLMAGLLMVYQLLFVNQEPRQPPPGAQKTQEPAPREPVPPLPFGQGNALEGVLAPRHRVRMLIILGPRSPPLQCEEPAVAELDDADLPIGADRQRWPTHLRRPVVQLGEPLPDLVLVVGEVPADLLRRRRGEVQRLPSGGQGRWL